MVVESGGVWAEGARHGGKGECVNSEQLRYFELTYQERNYSAAARLVPVSPQGLTKAIRALEKELGVTLFEPDASGMPAPTPYAHELYEFTEVTGSNLRLMHEAFERLRGQEAQELRLGCSLGVMGALGPDFLEGFRAIRPHVRVSYWETNDELCDKGLVAGDYDLALAVLPCAREFVSEPLYRCPVYFWVSAADPLAHKASLTLEDLCGHDVALPGEGFKCFETLRALDRERGLGLGRIFEMSEIFQLYEFAAGGRGVGFTARHHVELPVFARDGRVVALPLEGMSWGFGIERLATHALGDAEQAFWNWCVAYARRLPSDAL